MPPFNALAGRSPICWAVLVQIEHCAIVYSGRRKDKKAPRRNACNHFFIASLFTAKIRLREQREKEIFTGESYQALWVCKLNCIKKIFWYRKKEAGLPWWLCACNFPSVCSARLILLAKRTREKEILHADFISAWPRRANRAIFPRAKAPFLFVLLAKKSHRKIQWLIN